MYVYKLIYLGNIFPSDHFLFYSPEYHIWLLRMCLRQLLPVPSSGHFESIQHGTTLYQRRGYSSVAEHSTADREVTGSTPVAP